MSLRVKKLADSGLGRIRVGQHRIVYALDDNAQLVTVVRVARRKENTYRGYPLKWEIPGQARKISL